jgi:hypothetical protein
MACPRVNFFLKSSHITLIIAHKMKIVEKSKAMNGFVNTVKKLF